jgi:hypothetical protein
VIQVTRSATLVFGAPVERVLPMFTPAGERLWAEGWDPSFPAGERGDGADPGTVFTTSHSGPTTWIVVSRTDASVRYARVTHGRTAGLVTATCAPQAGGAGTAVTVTYELTAISPEAEAELDVFDRHFATMMDTWQQAVSAALGR